MGHGLLGITGKPQRGELEERQAPEAEDLWAVRRTSLGKEGWSPSSPIPGFRMIIFLCLMKDYIWLGQAKRCSGSKDQEGKRLHITKVWWEMLGEGPKTWLKCPGAATCSMWWRMQVLTFQPAERTPRQSWYEWHYNRSSISSKGCKRMLLLLEKVKPSLKGGRLSQAQRDIVGTLTKIGTDSKPEVFLETFEQVAEVYQWPHDISLWSQDLCIPSPPMLRTPEDLEGSPWDRNGTWKVVQKGSLSPV